MREELDCIRVDFLLISLERCTWSESTLQVDSHVNRFYYQSVEKEIDSNRRDGDFKKDFLPHGNKSQAYWAIAALQFS